MKIPALMKIYVAETENMCYNRIADRSLRCSAIDAALRRVGDLEKKEQTQL